MGLRGSRFYSFCTNRLKLASILPGTQASLYHQDRYWYWQHTDIGSLGGQEYAPRALSNRLAPCLHPTLSGQHDSKDFLFVWPVASSAACSTLQGPRPTHSHRTSPNLFQNQFFHHIEVDLGWSGHYTLQKSVLDTLRNPSAASNRAESDMSN